MAKEPCTVSLRPMVGALKAVDQARGGPNLARPYGDGNHRRISWRRCWDVDVEALTATHVPTGFVMWFRDTPDGFTAEPGYEVPLFGEDGALAVAQVLGLVELLKDGWEIFHTVMRKA